MAQQNKASDDTPLHHLPLILLRPSRRYSFSHCTSPISYALALCQFVKYKHSLISHSLYDGPRPDQPIKKQKSHLSSSSFHSFLPFFLDVLALREARQKDLRSPSTDKILWCGDGSSDFPAALSSDIVLARQNTLLEKLCRANQIPHRSFVTFATVQEMAQEWLDQQQQAQGQGQQSIAVAAAAAAPSASSNGGVLVEP
jgi:hypothetical protein